MKILTGLALLVLGYYIFLQVKHWLIQRKVDGGKTRQDLTDFLKQEGSLVSLARIKKKLPKRQQLEILKHPYFLDHILKDASEENLQEFIKKESVFSKIRISPRHLLLSIERGDGTFHQLENSLGKETIGRLTENLLPFQAYKSNHEKVIKLVNDGMSGKEIGLKSLGNKSLLWFALQSNNVAIVTEILRLGQEAISDNERSSSEVHFAIENCSTAVVDEVLKVKKLRIARDLEGRSFLEKMIERKEYGREKITEYAKRLKADGLNFPLQKYEAQLERMGALEEMKSLFLSPDVAKNRTEASIAVENINSQVDLGRYFKDLFGYFEFQKKLEQDLGYWISTSRKNTVKLFWAESFSEKSEMCHRLSGKKRGFAPPAIFSDVIYTSPAYSMDGFFKSVQELKSPSLILVDDFHLIAKQGDLQDHFLKLFKATFETSNHYWVFLITLSGVKMGSQVVSSLFKDELTRFVEYRDWRIPTWGLQELAGYALSRPDITGLLDEDGIAFVLSHIVEKKCGPEMFDKFLRRAAQLNITSTCSASEIKSIIESLRED
ncbi:MAG: hypothetical protein H0V66_01455 [Bdellovibrionales bacterium]|nr:hypothetical protein [Bdellovibrionales bacterium]